MSDTLPAGAAIRYATQALLLLWQKSGQGFLHDGIDGLDRRTAEIEMAFWV